MNATSPQLMQGEPVYLLVDRRADGTMRIVGEFVDPDLCLHHAKMLRWAGCPAQILLARDVDREAPQ